MSKAVFDVQDQFDWIRAAILERRVQKHMTWEEIAVKVHYNPDSLRRLVSGKQSWDWNPELRRALCKAVGVSVKLVLTMEDDIEIEGMNKNGRI